MSAKKKEDSEKEKINLEQRLDQLENLFRSLDATLIQMRMDLKKVETELRDNIKIDIQNTIYKAMGHWFLDKSLVQMGMNTF